MRRTALLAAAIGGLFASSSFAAITYSYQVSAAPVATVGVQPTGGTQGNGVAYPATGTPLYSIDVFALNTGGTTGVGLKALEVQGSGLTTLFQTSSLGVPFETFFDGDAARRSNPTAPRSFITLEDVNDGDATVLTETFAKLSDNGYSPAPSFGNFIIAGTSPSTQRTGAVNPFRITGTGNVAVADSTQNGGKGLQVARLIVALPIGQVSAAYTVTTQSGGSIGTAVQEAKVLTVGSTAVLNVAPVVLQTVVPTVTFGQNVSNGQSFSVTVNATDVNATDVLSGVLGSLPATVQNVTITGGGVAGVAGQTFTINGTVLYSANKTTVTIPIQINDNGSPAGSTPFNATFNVVPEPASLGLIGLAGLGLIRRRK